MLALRLLMLLPLLLLLRAVSCCQLYRRCPHAPYRANHTFSPRRRRASTTALRRSVGQARTTRTLTHSRRPCNTRTPLRRKRCTLARSPCPCGRYTWHRRHMRATSVGRTLAAPVAMPCFGGQVLLREQRQRQWCPMQAQPLFAPAQLLFVPLAGPFVSAVRPCLQTSWSHRWGHRPHWAAPHPRPHSAAPHTTDAPDFTSRAHRHATLAPLCTG